MASVIKARGLGERNVTDCQSKDLDCTMGAMPEHAAPPKFWTKRPQTRALKQKNVLFSLNRDANLIFPCRNKNIITGDYLARK